MKKSIGVVVIILVLGVLFFYFQKDVNEYFGSKVYFGDTEVNVEIVDTLDALEQGLSGRDSLAEDTGMLFVFPKSGQYSFWMKDMKFALDIIWLDEDKEIVYIKKNATPETYPESFGDGVGARYVLEVPAGFADKYNIHLGDKAEFDF